MISKIAITVVVLLGLITSWEDFKFHKIRNKWLVLGVFLGFGILLAYLFQGEFAYAGQVVLNSLIALIVAFLMWKFNVWAAGDAKLFFVYAFLIPLSFYDNYLPLFPSFVLLVNIFALILGYLFLRSIIFNFYWRILKGKQGDNISSMSFKEKIKQLTPALYLFLGFLILIMFFSGASYLFNPYFDLNVLNLQIFIFAVIIIFSSFFLKIFRKKKVRNFMLVVLVIFISVGFWWDFLFTIDLLFRSVLTMFVYLVIFIIIQRSVDVYLWFNESQEIGVDKLKRGMVVDKNEVKRLGLMEEISLHPNGLSREQAKRIKETAREKGRNFIRVYKPFPFALWEFIGVIFTLITQASVVNWALLFLK